MLPAYHLTAIVLCIALVGLAFGSFASALAYRAPRGQSWWALSGAYACSRCPNCEMRLTFRDLVPLVSWLACGGKCRHCGRGIGNHYIILEMASLILCLAIYASYGLSVSALLAMASVPFLLALCVIHDPRDITRHGISLSLFVYPAVLGALFQHDILVSHKSDSVFMPVIHFNSIFDYVIVMISYVAVCLLYAWLYTSPRPPRGTALGLAIFGAMCGLWLELYILPVFFLALFALAFVLMALAKIKKGNWVQSQNFVWPAVVTSFYCALLVQGHFAGMESFFTF